MSGKEIPTRLLNKDFFLLWQGQLVSQIGSQAFFVAMMYWTMEATNSASLMGTLMMFSMLPGIVLGPLGGTFADRHSRRAIIILSDLASGAGVLTVAGVFLAGPVAPEVLIAALFAIAVTTGVIQAFFRPAIMAAIPDLVPESRIGAANSMSQFSGQFSMIVGQGCGGILYVVLGAPLLFVMDGLSFLFSAASESLIRIPQTAKETPAGLENALKSFRDDLVEGLSFVWNWKGMRRFLLLVSFVNFLFMPLFVLMPFYVQLVLSRGAAWYGYLFAGFSLGSLLGFVLAGALPLNGPRRSRLLMVLLPTAGLLFSVLGWIGSKWLALAAMVAIGVLLGVFNILVMTLFQITTTSELLGRVMGLVLSLATAALSSGNVAGRYSRRLDWKKHSTDLCRLRRFDRSLRLTCCQAACAAGVSRL